MILKRQKEFAKVPKPSITVLEDKAKEIISSVKKDRNHRVTKKYPKPLQDFGDKSGPNKKIPVKSNESGSIINFD